jgi:glycerol uptake facilitator-like aquaporin
MFQRKQVAVLAAEFVGTAVLALVILSVQRSATQIGIPYFLSIAAGLALAGVTLMLNGNGENHFNPAITIGLWTVRQIRTVRAIAYIIVQMLGGWTAFHLYEYFAHATIQPIGGAYDGRLLIAEAVGALVLSIAFAATVFKGYDNGKKAGTVGIAYGLAIIIAASAVITSGNASAGALGIVNPAVALGEGALNAFGTMTSWWAYAFGPILGGIIGFNLYALLFAEESSFVRVRAIVSERFNRVQTAPTLSEAVVVEDAASKRGAGAVTKAYKTKMTRSKK